MLLQQALADCMGGARAGSACQEAATLYLPVAGSRASSGGSARAAVSRLG